MLGHTCHAGNTKTIALEAFNISIGEFGGQLRILPEGAINPTPSGFSGQVSHWMERQADTYSKVLAPGNICELIDKIRVTNTITRKRTTPPRIDTRVVITILRNLFITQHC